MGEQPAEPDLPLQFHFSSVFQDQLLLDTTRSRGIAVELHGELSFALGRGTQIRRITEHLGKRDLGLNP